MQKSTPPSWGQFLFILILLLAFGLRFVNLGVQPLSEFEARAALAAEALARGSGVDLGAQPAYVLLTSLLFRLLGSGNFLARLSPALAGLALVALPYYWRESLGHKTALVLALFLALDPGLVALARLAGGYSLALSAGLWAASLLARGRAAAGGILAAVALLAGPSLYFGLGAAALTWLLTRAQRPALPKTSWRQAAPAFLATLVLGGTLLFSVPQGVAGPGLTLAGFLFGEADLAPASVGEVLFALFGYGLPALLFGLLRILRSRDAASMLAATFGAAALLLVLLHPQRQVADLAWVLLPLWWLAAAEISQHLQAPREEPWAAYGEFALVSLLSIFFFITLARASDEAYLLYFEPGRLLPIVNPDLWLSIGVLLIAAMASLLIGLGWSLRAAGQGLVWSLSLATCLCLLAAGSRFGRQPVNLANELWQPGPAVADLRALLATVDDLSFWGAGQPNALAIQARSQSAALRWALRGYPAASSGQTSAALAVAPASQEPPTEFAAYRGQSFALQSQRAWQGWPPNLFAWLLFRQAPNHLEQIILWVRSDLFLDGASLQDFPEAIP